MKTGILFCILLMCSCCNETRHRIFTSISDLSNYERKVHKPSLIGLVSELKDMEIITGNDLLEDSFICYTTLGSKQCIFNKIIPADKYPLYIFFSSDTIASFFSYDEMKQMLKDDNGKLFNYAMLDSNCRAYKKSDIAYWNGLLKLCDIIEQSNDNSIVDISDLEYLIEERDEFYGKYLLAQFYKIKDAIKAEELYASLWINSTPEEMKIYPEEFLDILKNKNKIALIESSDIEFVCTEYDFGTIDISDKVTCKFYYMNNSDHKFVIHNIITTCGCTVPFWTRQPIEPNTQDSISVEFSPRSIGKNQKTIIVEGNCKEKIKLKIKALVR